MNPKSPVKYKKYIAEESNIKIQDINKIEELDNLIIKGDNLLVLKQLVTKYANKVKLIYIDPPLILHLYLRYTVICKVCFSFA